MKDTEPEEMARRLWLYEKIREVVLRYGFRMVEPTTLENLKTLEAKSGSGIRDEIYWFKDKGGRSLGLRFDLTVGLARMVASRFDLPEPIKLAAIGGNWRYDEPQFARYRYFTQWDVEIFGSANPLADAEAICVGVDILANLGLREFVVRISNRKLAESYLKQLGISSGEKLEQSLRIIDKVRKESRARLAKEFGAIKIEDKTLERVFSYISLNGTPSTVLDELAALSLTEGEAKEGLTELETLADALAAFGRLDRCVYDMSIVRGIGYYDGIVFECFDKDGEDVGSIFGGGRYDKLCKVYGRRDIPATGVAGGIERLMISVERAKLFPKSQVGPKVFIASAQEASRLEVVRLVQELRDSGVPAEFDLKRRPLSRQVEYADSARIPYLIVLGPQEIESKVVKLKSMATRAETAIPLNELPAKLLALN
jgi:histidyl-tRNA synthetase